MKNNISIRDEESNIINSNTNSSTLNQDNGLLKQSLIAEFILSNIKGILFWIWPGIVIYVASYYRRFNQDNSEILLLCMSSFINIVVMVLKLCIKPYSKPKIVVTIGSLLIAASFFLGYFIKNTNIFMICSLFFNSLGLSFIYSYISGFENQIHKEFFNFGESLGGIFILILSFLMLNPENLSLNLSEYYYDECVSSYIPIFFLILAIILFSFSFALREVQYIEIIRENNYFNKKIYLECSLMMGTLS